MGNHYMGDTTWGTAKSILDASSLWEVHDRPDDTAISVRLLFKEEGRDQDHDWMSLYYNHSPEESVKAENLLYGFLMLALELTLRTRFIDLPCYAQYTPWYQIGGWKEFDYNRHLVEVAEILGLDSELPTWNPEVLAEMAAEEDQLIAEAEANRPLRQQRAKERPKMSEDVGIDPDDFIKRLASL
jgi:hypothetical protein